MGIEWDKFGDSTKAIMVSRLSAEEQVLGFMLLAISPARFLDEEQRRDVQTLSSRMRITLTAMIRLEQARQNEIKLYEQLANRTKEALEIEDRYEALSELDPAPIWYVNPAGTMTYANDAWYDMTERKRFPSCFHQMAD